jgi:hypothetical protein
MTLRIKGESVSLKPDCLGSNPNSTIESIAIVGAVLQPPHCEAPTHRNAVRIKWHTSNVPSASQMPAATATLKLSILTSRECQR